VLWSARYARRHVAWLSSHAAQPEKRAAGGPPAGGACAATERWLAAARAHSAVRHRTSTFEARTAER